MSSIAVCRVQQVSPEESIRMLGAQPVGSQADWQHCSLVTDVSAISPGLQLWSLCLKGVDHSRSVSFLSWPLGSLPQTVSGALGGNLYFSVLASRIPASLGRCGVGFAGRCWFHAQCKYSKDRAFLSTRGILGNTYSFQFMQWKDRPTEAIILNKIDLENLDE